MTTATLEAPAVEFIESLGLITEADGLPRIAGRMLGLLIVEPGPFRFDELAERLHVSRASISTNTRLLERLGLVERFTRPGERKDLFRLGQDPYGRLLTHQLERMRRIRETARNCLEALDEESEIGRRRLDAMTVFYELAIEGTQRLLDEWQERGP